MRARIALAALLLAAGGCEVARPDDLLTRLWTCEVRSDCLDGWGCADRNVLGEDFCRPACDPLDPATCEDGICTKTGECLRTCVIWGDIASACPDGHECIRTDLLGTEGVCFPTDVCSRSDECAPGTECFNDTFRLPSAIPGVEYASDHLFCVAVPDESERCATGYLLIPAPDPSESYCLPRCDSEGARCPPALTCLDDLGFLFAQPGTSPCYPGYWGLPCDDDAQCILGQCLEVGEGRRACTFTCDDADRTFGQVGRGCETLEMSASNLRLDALSYACEMVGTERLCVPRGTAGAPCNDDTLCVPELECRTFESMDGDLLRFCSRDCETEADCVIAGSPITAYCQRAAAGGSCVPRSYEGGGCLRPEHCRPGLECREMTCMAPAVPPT